MNTLLRPRFRSRRRLRIISFVLIGTLVMGAIAADIWYLTRDTPTPKKQAVVKPVVETPETGKTVRFIATGDMLPHDTVNQAAKTAAGYDYLPLFSEVQPYLLSADMSFCNQEAPSAPSFAVTGYPTFNAPTQFAKDLHTLGCNVINLANNHTNDKSQLGIDETLQTWKGLNTLAIAGAASSQAEQQKISYFVRDGVTFAFLSYARCTNNPNLTTYGVNLLNKTLVDTQIAEAKQQADMIIVGTHWCRENVSTQDSEQDEWASYFASKGVDIVVGTGPHVLQPVKRLPKAGGGETVVWFSLGNFLSTQEQVNGLIGGIAYMDINLDTKTVTKLSFLPTYMHYEWTASEKAAGNLLARKNLKLYPLDLAEAPLGRSQNNTTVETQTTRVTELLNTYTPVTILTSKNAPKQ